MTRKFTPKYDKRKDYNFNAPDFFDKLGKDQELLKILAKRIWEYDQTLNEMIEEIQGYTDIFNETLEHFNSVIEDKTIEWLNLHMEDILTNATKLVWFGLTDDGYFMAVIPENWSDVQFDTTNKGQLMLIN